MQTYQSISGQSIYDICLQTYGVLDYLYKLMIDNGILGLNSGIPSGTVFSWDDTLVQDQNLNVSFLASNKLFSTDYSQNGSVLYPNIGGAGQINPATVVVPVTPSSSGSIAYGYQGFFTQYTSSTDGATVFTPMDASNTTNLVGYDIIDVTNEIHPLKTTQWIWSKTTGVLTLIGATCDAGMTLYINYQKKVTS